MKYIIVGPTIINDIVFADGSEIKEQIGGSIFCVAGIKLWSDDCLYVSNVGEDFPQYYGKWMDTNKCSYNGLNYNLPHTQYTQLIYGESELHDERSIYGPEMEELLSKIDVITAQQIAESCDSDTKGIYIEASEYDDMWNNLHCIKNKCNAKIIWELPTSATMQKARKNNVLSTIRKVDIYSINLPEAMSLFDKPDEKSAINAIIKLGVPCFLRVGKKGSYMICNGQSYFAPSVDFGEVIDTTGCGNCSTATALFCYCEGFDPTLVATMANISAAYNLLQYGPYPNISSARNQALKILGERTIKG